MYGNQNVTADFKLSSRSFPAAKLPKVMRRAFTSWEINADSPSLAPLPWPGDLQSPQEGTLTSDGETRSLDD